MLATKAVRCDPIPQTSGLRRFTCKAETIHKPVATGRTMRLLRDLAARKEPLSEENEARAAGIYLRVIARMERVGEPAGAEAVKNERGRLSEAKELAETMIVSVERNRPPISLATCTAWREWSEPSKPARIRSNIGDSLCRTPCPGDL